MQKLPYDFRVVVIIVNLVAISGCVSTFRQPRTFVTSTRRPAACRRSNEDQSEAHEHDGPRGQLLPDMAVTGAEEGNVGTYVAGGSTAQGHHPLAIGSIGTFKMPTDTSTVRIGVFGADKDGIGVGGVEGGIRLHTTNRLSPYVGLSGDLGFSSMHTGYWHGRRQPNPSHPYATSQAYGLAAIGPEAGISYWLNNSTRLNAGASYLFALDQPQFLVFGLSLDYVLGDGFAFLNTTASKNDPRVRNGDQMNYVSHSSDDDSSDADRTFHQIINDAVEQPHNDSKPE